MKKIGLALSAVTVSIHGSFHPPVSDAFLRTESQQQTTRLSELLARVKPFSYPAVSAFMTSTYFYFGFARIHSDYLVALVFLGSSSTFFREAIFTIWLADNKATFSSFGNVQLSSRVAPSVYSSTWGLYRSICMMYDCVLPFLLTAE